MHPILQIANIPEDGNQNQIGSVVQSGQGEVDWEKMDDQQLMSMIRMEGDDQSVEEDEEIFHGHPENEISYDPHSPTSRSPRG